MKEECKVIEFKEMTRKERRKAKREKFAEEHPKMAEFLLKTEITVGVLEFFAVPYFAGRASKFEDVKFESELNGYIKASNDMKNELGRAERDFIDEDGKYHQDLKFGAYAVWKDKETYLDAERARLDSLSNDPFLK